MPNFVMEHLLCQESALTLLSYPVWKWLILYAIAVLRLLNFILIDRTYVFHDGNKKEVYGNTEQ